ncbi:MAG: hypothetical protein PHY59_06030 [Methanobacterium sp.]|nr:hypothetical protein [Methanobacterium sp.]
MKHKKIISIMAIIAMMGVLIAATPAVNAKDKTEMKCHAMQDDSGDNWVN